MNQFLKSTDYLDFVDKLCYQIFEKIECYKLKSNIIGLNINLQQFDDLYSLVRETFNKTQQFIINKVKELIVSMLNTLRLTKIYQMRSLNNVVYQLRKKYDMQKYEPLFKYHRFDNQETKVKEKWKKYRKLNKSQKLQQLPAIYSDLKMSLDEIKTCEGKDVTIFEDKYDKKEDFAFYTKDFPNLKGAYRQYHKKFLYNTEKLTQSFERQNCNLLSQYCVNIKSYNEKLSNKEELLIDSIRMMNDKIRKQLVLEKNNQEVSSKVQKKKIQTKKKISVLKNKHRSSTRIVRINDPLNRQQKNQYLIPNQRKSYTTAQILKLCNQGKFKNANFSPFQKYNIDYPVDQQFQIQSIQQQLLFCRVKKDQQINQPLYYQSQEAKQKRKLDRLYNLKKQMNIIIKQQKLIEVLKDKQEAQKHNPRRFDMYEANRRNNYYPIYKKPEPQKQKKQVKNQQIPKKINQLPNQSKNQASNNITQISKENSKATKVGGTISTKRSEMNNKDIKQQPQENSKAATKVGGTISTKRSEMNNKDIKQQPQENPKAATKVGGTISTKRSEITNKLFNSQLNDIKQQPQENQYEISIKKNPGSSKIEKQIIQQIRKQQMKPPLNSQIKYVQATFSNRSAGPSHMTTDIKQDVSQKKPIKQSKQQELSSVKLNKQAPKQKTEQKQFITSNKLSEVTFRKQQDKLNLQEKNQPTKSLNPNSNSQQLLNNNNIKKNEQSNKKNEQNNKINQSINLNSSLKVVKPADRPWNKSAQTKSVTEQLKKKQQPISNSPRKLTDSKKQIKQNNEKYQEIIQQINLDKMNLTKFTDTDTKTNYSQQQSLKNTQASLEQSQNIVIQKIQQLNPKELYKKFCDYFQIKDHQNQNQNNKQYIYRYGIKISKEMFDVIFQQQYNKEVYEKQSFRQFVTYLLKQLLFLQDPMLDKQYIYKGPQIISISIQVANDFMQNQKMIMENLTDSVITGLSKVKSVIVYSNDIIVFQTSLLHKNKAIKIKYYKFQQSINQEEIRKIYIENLKKKFKGIIQMQFQNGLSSIKLEPVAHHYFINDTYSFKQHCIEFGRIGLILKLCFPTFEEFNQDNQCLNHIGFNSIFERLKEMQLLHQVSPLRSLTKKQETQQENKQENKQEKKQEKNETEKIEIIES